MSAETTFVFLDTQVFKDQDLDFSSRNLRRFIRLAEVGELHHVQTYITEREIRKHITSQADEAFRQAKSYL